MTKYGFRPLRTDGAIFALVTDAQDKVVFPNKKSIVKVPDTAEEMCQFEDVVFGVGDLQPGEKVAGIVCIHVDDTLRGGDATFQTVWSQLKSDFQIGDEWEEDPTARTQMYTFLGRDIEVNRDKNGKRSIKLTQGQYTQKLQEMPGVKDGETDRKEDEPLTETEHTLYRALVGRLNWVAYKTRGDLTCLAHDAATKNVSPTVGDARLLCKYIREAKHF
jgi:hypothetical protein